MRDALLAGLLVLALAVGFSTHGPVKLPDSHGLGPGDDRAGESPLVVSGPGAGIVTVTQADAPARQEPEETQSRTGGSGQGAEAPEEEHMNDWSNLIWYAIGVMTVLIGEFAGVVVACAWQRLRKENKEE